MRYRFIAYAFGLTMAIVISGSAADAQNTAPDPDIRSILDKLNHLTARPSKLPISFVPICKDETECFAIGTKICASQGYATSLMYGGRGDGTVATYVCSD